MLHTTTVVPADVSDFLPEISLTSGFAAAFVGVTVVDYFWTGLVGVLAATAGGYIFFSSFCAGAGETLAYLAGAGAFTGDAGSLAGDVLI